MKLSLFLLGVAAWGAVENRSPVLRAFLFRMRKMASLSVFLGPLPRDNSSFISSHIHLISSPLKRKKEKRTFPSCLYIQCDVRSCGSYLVTKKRKKTQENAEKRTQRSTFFFFCTKELSIYCFLTFFYRFSIFIPINKNIFLTVKYVPVLYL